MARVKTFRNGGRLDITPDLNGIQDDYDSFFSNWKPLGRTWFNNGDINSGHSGQITLVGNMFGSTVLSHYFDPADRAATGRTVKLRLRSYVSTNAVSPACTFTVAMHPVTVTYSASGSQNLATFGAAVASSGVALTPGSSVALLTGTGTEFTHPAAGLYAVVLTLSAAPAVNSRTLIRADLQHRQV